MIRNHRTSTFLNLSLAKTRAQSIIQSLIIRNPHEIDIELIAYQRGTKVFEFLLTGCDGRLVRTENCGIITVSSRIEEPGKKRFVIAHELGHFEIHQNLPQYRMCVDEKLQYWYRDKSHENEANVFASELLMPEMLFRPKITGFAPNFNDVGRVADEFATSLTATAMRYVELSSYPCSLLYSENGTVKWIRRNDDFTYQVEVGRKLDQYTVAADLFRGKSVGVEMQEVPVSAWLRGEFASDSVIWEHSVPMPRYNAVLTLLWLDDEPEVYGVEDDVL